jgi:hypothetical protein
MITDGRIAAFHLFMSSWESAAASYPLLRHDGFRRVMTMGEVTAVAKQTLRQLLTKQQHQSANNISNYGREWLSVCK